MRITYVDSFPTGFANPFTISMDGQVLGTYGPKDEVDFTNFPGGGVSSFSITGINPLVDSTDAKAFLVRLTFNTPVAGFEVESIAVPGDYNGNGIVDAADYVVWRKTDGTSTGYSTWRTHFGQTFGSGSGVSANAAVPEPATLVLLMFAAAGWCLRRGRSA